MVIGCYRWLYVVIRCYRWLYVVIGCYRWLWVVIDGYICGYGTLYVVIGCSRWLYVHGYRMLLEVICGYRMVVMGGYRWLYVVIRCYRWLYRTLDRIMTVHSIQKLPIFAVPWYCKNAQFSNNCNYVGTARINDERMHTSCLAEAPWFLTT